MAHTADCLMVVLQKVFEGQFITQRLWIVVVIVCGLG